MLALRYSHLLDINRNESLYCIRNSSDEPDTRGCPVESFVGLYVGYGDPRASLSRRGIAPTDFVIP